MKVTMLTTISGTRDGIDWPPRGESISLDDAEAAVLIAAGHARKVENAGNTATAAPAPNRKLEPGTTTTKPPAPNRDKPAPRRRTTKK